MSADTTAVSGLQLAAPIVTSSQSMERKHGGGKVNGERITPLPRALVSPEASTSVARIFTDACTRRVPVWPPHAARISTNRRSSSRKEEAIGCKPEFLGPVGRQFLAVAVAF